MVDESVTTIAALVARRIAQENWPEQQLAPVRSRTDLKPSAMVLITITLLVVEIVRPEHELRTPARQASGSMGQLTSPSWPRSLRCRRDLAQLSFHVREGALLRPAPAFHEPSRLLTTSPIPFPTAVLSKSSDARLAV